jgi:outer membrane protein assembly factor BamB
LHYQFPPSTITIDKLLKRFIPTLSLILLGSSLIQDALPQEKPTPRLTTLAKASPLSEDAITSDWPRFNGPDDNAKSSETKLLKKWPKDGPKLLWEIRKGEGYASPAIKDGILILFHRMDEKEMIEAIDAEKGTPIWQFEYPVEYRDRFGYSNGPRASPVIKGDLIYAHGVTAWLTCLELKTGRKIWQRNLAKEFEIPQYFFGKGSTPLVLDDKLIVNVGGSMNRCVVAFDRLTGSTKWITKDTWGASYSSPTKAVLNDKEVCLVFTGGESRPPEGGLLVIDPKDGKKLARFPWRASGYESANAVPPIPVGENRVFLSECYEKGGVMLEFDKEFKPSVLWTDETINVHWMTPILSGKTIYGVAGRHQQGADIFCINAQNGKPYWRDRVNWTGTIGERSLRLELFRCSLLKLEDHFLCLSEIGSLLRMKLDEKGWKIEEKAQLFFAPGTWTLPALSRGLLYVMQNETDRHTGHQPRLLCYDFRQR